jgi:hypothetical protein
MRFFLRAFLIPFSLSFANVAMLAQSAKSGAFQGKTFTESYFKIAFELPSFLDPQPLDSIDLHSKDTVDAWLMAVAREGTEPYGIILMSQHLKRVFIVAQPGDVISAKDFLRRVRNSRAPGDVIGAEGHEIKASGLTFDWLDWKEASGEPSSAVVTQRGDYLIVARCNAKNEKELQSMKDAFFGMRVTAR